MAKRQTRLEQILAAYSGEHAVLRMREHGIALVDTQELGRLRSRARRATFLEGRLRDALEELETYRATSERPAVVH